MMNPISRKDAIQKRAWRKKFETMAIEREKQ